MGSVDLLNVVDIPAFHRRVVDGEDQIGNPNLPTICSRESGNDILDAIE